MAPDFRWLETEKSRWFTKKDTNNDDLDSITKWVQIFENYLEESRKKETLSIRKQKKRKLNDSAGRGVEGFENIQDCKTGNDDPQPHTSGCEEPEKIIVVRV